LYDQNADVVGRAPGNGGFNEPSARIHARSLVVADAVRPGDVYGFLVIHLVPQAIGGEQQEFALRIDKECPAVWISDHPLLEVSVADAS
jgi:hypothetical protein